MQPSPCFIVDVEKLRSNLEILADVKAKADCHIVLALKGYALWHTFPMIAEYLDGCCASGSWEAELANEQFVTPASKHILTYSPAYKDEEIARLSEISSHLDFNSSSQWQRFQQQALTHPRYLKDELKYGIRINPEHSTGSTQLYDPCAAGSRLGATLDSLTGCDLTGISGLHFHTLCEQGSEDLASTLKAVDEKFGHILNRPEITWLNMGGGHWITKPDYNRDLLIQLIKETKEKYNLADIWLEPGEAIAIHTGILRSTVIDIVQNGEDSIAILDVSATAHMPDVLEMPYRPDVIAPDGSLAQEPNNLLHTYILAGGTCLAGDVIGKYSFNKPLNIDDTLDFDDMSHYTMVKTTMFNGVKHPAIALKNPDSTLHILREFSYQDFKDRLG